MGIALIGINHKTAPIHVREKVSFSPDSIEGAYALLKTYKNIDEAFILSTCNRVEIYGIGDDVKAAELELRDFLYRSNDVASAHFKPYLYAKHSSEAVEHLLKVASGLDSLVIGEGQILGQIKWAYDKAADCGSAGPCLHKLLQVALRTGKKVRSETEISRGVTSIPGAALELIKKEDNICQKKVLIIGAGKVGRITVSRLASSGIKDTVVINRDLSRAEIMKQNPNVRVESFQALKREICSADIVIAATASEKYIITRDIALEALSKKQEGILFIDMGVPRNIEESIGGIGGARLYNVDDLGGQIDETLSVRRSEVTKAQKIIKAQIDSCRIDGVGDICQCVTARAS